MVILWTNLEGEKVEPSPTSQRPIPEHGRNNSNGQLSLKRRVQVALKPSLPSLFLPLIKPNDENSNGRAASETYSPGANTDSVSLPSSLDSSPTLPDDDLLRLVVIRSRDLSPDSGVLIQYEPTPSPSVPVNPVRPTTLPAQRAKPPKTLPIIYGTENFLPTATKKQILPKIPLLFSLQLVQISFSWNDSSLFWLETVLTLFSNVILLFLWDLLACEEKLITVEMGNIRL